jgi:hypothetical protein
MADREKMLVHVHAIGDLAVTEALDGFELASLSHNQSLAFQYLQEVVKAHVDRFPEDGTKGRPEKVIDDITINISTEFNTVFKEFWSRESIYGFGDIQLKYLYDKVMHFR